MQDREFNSTLSGTENADWNAFKFVCTNFLGNHKAGNYREIVSKMLKYFQTVKCNISLKLHFLHSHPEFFPQNLGEVSDEYGDRYDQDTAMTEKLFVGRWNWGILA